MLDKTKTELLATTAEIPHPGFELVKSELLDLTPEVVKDFRTIESAATERDLSDSRVNHLDRKIGRGLAVTFHWITAELDGKTSRINGQHSSTMLANRCMMVDGKLITEMAWPKGLKVLLEHYKVKDKFALGMLFRQFDDRRSARTTLDISGVYQGMNPALHQVKRRIGKLAVDGYVWYQRVVAGATPQIGDDAYTLLNDETLHPWILWLDELFSARSKEMQIVPVVAAIIGTYMVNEGVAKDFWQQVVAVANSEDDPSPQTVLANWLVNIEAEKIERPEPVNIYQGCIFAWNAFRANKGIATIKDDKKKNFLVIHE